ncbi:MAG: hypothetical protein IKG82_01275, partial [Oscillospiraceae bacterium]|nr:hypothetical protein [Oscillospiraceae bacterium]
DADRSIKQTYGKKPRALTNMPVPAFSAMQRSRNFFPLSIAFSALICYKRVEPASVFAPMQRTVFFFRISPIAIHPII